MECFLYLNRERVWGTRPLLPLTGQEARRRSITSKVRHSGQLLAQPASCSRPPFSKGAPVLSPIPSVIHSVTWLFLNLKVELHSPSTWASLWLDWSHTTAKWDPELVSKPGLPPGSWGTWLGRASPSLPPSPRSPGALRPPCWRGQFYSPQGASPTTHRTRERNHLGPSRPAYPPV